MLVMAGKPVDATIDLLLEHMESGDIIIDGGNEWCVITASHHSIHPSLEHGMGSHAASTLADSHAE